MWHNMDSMITGLNLNVLFMRQKINGTKITGDRRYASLGVTRIPLLWSAGFHSSVSSWRIVWVHRSVFVVCKHDDGRNFSFIIVKFPGYHAMVKISEGLKVKVTVTKCARKLFLAHTVKSGSINLNENQLLWPQPHSADFTNVTLIIRMHTFDTVTATLTLPLDNPNSPPQCTVDNLTDTTFSQTVRHVVVFRSVLLTRSWASRPRPRTWRQNTFKEHFRLPGAREHTIKPS